MDRIPTSESRRPRRRGQPGRKARWNYKRIAFAVLIMIFVMSSAAYGGYFVARKLQAPVETEKSVDNTKEKESPSAYTPPKPTKSVTETVEATKPAEPSYVEHTIEAGDTFYKISKKYNVPIDEIKEASEFTGSDNNLQIGMVLKIPAKGSADTSTTVQRKDGQNIKNAASITSIKVSDQEISKGPGNAKKVALTFDAGSGSEVTPGILEALSSAGVKATFFLTGKWVEQNPKLTKEIAEDGHIIANHTYSHPDLTQETDENIIYQLRKAEEIIKGTAGVSSKPMFRPPYGARNARVLRVAAESGYRSIYWTIDSLDWKPTMSSSQIKNRVLNGLESGAIILMHCDSKQTAAMLPELIEEIQGRGYETVTVPELFE